MSRKWKGWIVPLLLAVGALMIFGPGLQEAWRYGSQANSASASDSLPLYLGTNALAQGLDPTQSSDLEVVYAAMDGSVSKALFSVLYPTTMFVMLQPLAGLSHPGFLFYWRGILFGVVLLGMALAGSVGVTRRRALTAGVLGACLCTSLFPFFIESQLALGQANLAIAGCFGVAMGLSGWGRNGLAAVVAAVGASGKLVPAILAWPLLFGRGRRGLAAALMVGLGLLAMAAASVPIGHIIQNVLDTLAFQRSVEPHWLHQPGLPDWARFVGILKRPGLTLLSLALVAYGSWKTRDTARAAETDAVGMGLLAVALGADGAGAAAPYATLAMPGAVMLLTWPLAERSGWPSFLGVAAAGAVWALLPGGLEAPIHDTEMRLVAACTVIWCGVAFRLCTLLQPWTLRPVLGATTMLLAVIIHTAIYAWWPPYGGPKTMPASAPGSMTSPAPDLTPVRR